MPHHAPLRLRAGDGYWLVQFEAMASPCEVLLDTPDRKLAKRLGRIAQNEVMRIEKKYSRYLGGNIIHRINQAKGQPIEVDEETAGLLSYADHCFRISDGLFDITSGVLRRAWRFDGRSKPPGADKIEQLLPYMGWSRVSWQPPILQMPSDFEIDLGGIGKEYAVDRSAQLLAAASDISFLINYGGDLFANRPPGHKPGWLIGLESAEAVLTTETTTNAIHEQFVLAHGGIATSGDSRRYLIHEGKRYSHIINPLTGWPVQGAPRSVTVLANSCTEAGILSTLAMLQGSNAESFLAQQDIRYWTIR